MHSWFMLFFVLHYVDAIPVGLIRNISFTLATPSFLNTMNGSREQCLCAMMASANISALNYFSNNTCQLFSNVSLTNAYYSWTPDVNSQFYFLQLPTKATVITQDTTARAVSTNTHQPMSTASASTKTSVFTTAAAIISPSTVAGSGVAGFSMKQLNAPNDVFVTTNGTLYVADFYNNRVQIFGPTNTTAISSQGGINQPISVCVDNTSDYYVTELVLPINRISKWPVNQTVLTLFNAYGIAMDSRRNLYLSTLDNTIVFWNGTLNTGTIIVPSSKGLNQSRHISLDEGNQALYIADSLNNRIVKLHLDIGNLTVVAGGHGVGTAANQLYFPAGVCVSKRDGTIYVADTKNHRIQKWVVNATAGVTVLGNANGTAGNRSYELYHPYSVALNAAETFLYVADSDNNRVQRLLLS